MNDEAFYGLAQLRQDLTSRLIPRVATSHEGELVDALVAVEELLVRHERGEVTADEIRAGLATVEALTERDALTDPATDLEEENS